MGLVLLLIIILLIACNFESFMDGLLGRRKGYDRLPEIRMFRKPRIQISQEVRDFKKKIKKEGRFYYLGDFYNTKREFIKFVRGLLKYKKHEWTIMGFCRDNRVIGFWMNKGKDNKEGIIGLGPEETIKICKDEGYDRILLCHNHPGDKVIVASVNDRYTFAAYKEILGRENIKSEFYIE